MFSYSFVSATELNTTSTSLILPSISFDSGLVEISALTTIISSSAAASLALGSRGPSGLAWAATSGFGIIAVVKACLSAATPGWLRETIGVRSTASDLALGFPLDLGSNSHNSKRVRKTLDSPIAIQCRGDTQNKNRLSRNSSIGNDIYAYDFSTSAMINNVPDTEPGEPTRIFAYAFYAFRRKHETKLQIGSICFSFLKLIESYCLWKNNSNMLAIVTSLPWCHFLIFAIVAEVTELNHAKHPEMTPGIIDIVTGKLPVVTKQNGGSRKIIIGAVQNPKHTLFWTIMWGLGAIICTSSTLLTYLLLGKQSKEVIMMWAEFQTLWMVIRLLAFHLISPDDPLANRQLAEQPLQSLPHDMKIRVMRLTTALSKYQIYSHPRGDYSYPHDCFETTDIPSFIARHALAYPTDNLPENLTSIQMSIKAVIGDTTLSSASWIAGSKLTPMELYDSCVVVFDMNERSSSDIEPSAMLAIPAVRVLSGITVGQSQPAADPEKVATSHFPPKGASNVGYGLSWRYWIPIDFERWVFLSTPENSLDICGQHMGSVMSSVEVTEQLAAGRFNIGFSRVGDVKAALELSRQSFGHVVVKAGSIPLRIICTYKRATKSYE